MKLIEKLKKPYLLGTLFLLLLMLYWLFLFPHGLADNGDFFRAIHNYGLSDISTNSKENYYNYFLLKFKLSDNYIDNRVDFFSTQSLIISVAVFLNNLFFHNGVFDIRFVGGIYALFFLIASYAILRLLDQLVGYLFKGSSERLRLIVTYTFTALYVFVFGDFSYLFYFNSFFGEPLSYVCLLLYVALTAKILVAKHPGIRLIVVYLLVIIMLVGGKQQNAPIGVLSAIFLIRLIILKKDKAWKYLMVASTVIVATFSVLTFTSISGEIQYINKYHSITMGVMEVEGSSADLKAINLSPQLVLLRGTTIYDRYPMMLTSSPQMYKLMYDNATPFKLAEYYLTHPASLGKILDFVALHAYEIKPNMVGNYLITAGQAPLAKSYFFSLWSTIKQYIFPKSFGFILLLYAVTDGCLLVIYLKALKQNAVKKRLAIEFIVLVQLISLFQVAIAFIGAGEADLAKHLFLFNVTFDLLFVFTVFGITYWIIKTRLKG